MNERQFLPCPFCGSSRLEEPELLAVGCRDCGARIKIESDYRGNWRRELIKRWNHRKPMEEVIEKMEACTDMCKEISTKLEVMQRRNERFVERYERRW